MSKSLSPFTKAQLLPQEETLEIYKQKGELFIGIPKETHFQEKRVCLTPDAVSALTAITLSTTCRTPNLSTQCSSRNRANFPASRW